MQLMPDRIVGFTPATGKVAGRTELLIRIHPRVDALGVLALASQHGIRLFLRAFLRALPVGGDVRESLQRRGEHRGRK